MIYSITGLLRQVAPNYCVVEACGVGYRCSASTYTLSSLPGKGQEVTLLTHLWVKEDGVELFGFSTEQERLCFRMLIGVSGVGPRVALAILSDSAPDRLMPSPRGTPKPSPARRGSGPSWRSVLSWSCAIRSATRTWARNWPPKAAALRRWRAAPAAPPKARPSARWWRWATVRPTRRRSSPRWRIRWRWTSWCAAPSKPLCGADPAHD